MFCPFAQGKADVLNRYRESPCEAAEALFLEHVEKNQAGRWVPTSKAGRSLNGEIQVFRHVWPRDRDLPPGCVDSELVYMRDEVPEDLAAPPSVSL